MVITHLIRNETDYSEVMARLEKIFHAEPGTPESDEMDLLVHLIEVYEKQHYPVGPADPIEAIKFRMEQANLQPKDLIPYIGSRARVSEVLSGKRELSKAMIARLHKGLGIPLKSLLALELSEA